MSADPDFVPAAVPPRDGRGSDALSFGESAPGSYVVPAPELPFYPPEAEGAAGQGVYVPPIYSVPPRVLRERLVPHLGDAAIFFLLAVILMIAGEGLTVWAAKNLHLFGRESWEALANDARLSIPSQALEYLFVFATSAVFFGLMWRRPFLQGIHWHASAVKRRVRWLVLLGLIVGIGVGFGGDFLPMPKNAPIVQDMMNTAAGAWLMFLFSFTGAPLMEELAFRGFMLPSLINAFRWISERGWMPAGAVRWIGIPISVLLTSCCFALMHSPQVSHSWAAVLLIFLVSLVLCIVRLRLDSVLASAIVHGAYNFTLFAGILVSTDGFRHLDKLKG